VNIGRVLVFDPANSRAERPDAADRMNRKNAPARFAVCVFAGCPANSPGQRLVAAGLRDYLENKKKKNRFFPRNGCAAFPRER